ncbi:MAG TPA: hypothetical protein VF399_06030 [bacterium]
MLKVAKKPKYSTVEMKLIKLLDRIVDLIEVELIVDLIDRDLPKHKIREILGIEMRRITYFSKIIKKKGAKNG